MREGFKPFNSKSSITLENEPSISSIIRSKKTAIGQGNQTVSDETNYPFSVDIIEYYDNTQYFNIESELPSCVVGEVFRGYTPTTKYRVLDEDKTVTSKIEDLMKDYTLVPMIDPNGNIICGVISTIYDTYNFQIPADLYPEQPTVDIVIDDFVVSSYPVWNDNMPTAFMIPVGTIVSTLLPAGTVEEYTDYEPYTADVMGLCASFIDDFNTRYWERNFDQELEYPEILLKEVGFYEQFFTDLQKCETEKEKIYVYINKIYPLLSASWETFNTSGFIDDPNLYVLQEQYSGKLPGKFLTQNYKNTNFLSIATMPYIPNLISATSKSDETSLYLSKPFYENVAYYILLMTNEILKMNSYDEHGLGLPTNGWKQNHIEYHGLNSLYENSKNVTEEIVIENQYIDCDGPWIYDYLIKFIKLYTENNNLISYETMRKFVDETYHIQDKAKEKIIDQLFKFQHEIIKKQEYSISNFQIDFYKNQYMLYKLNDYNKFGDVGEIWIRQYNYALAIPLMNFIKLYDSNETYLYDKYDVLQCNYDITYANMLKEITNNTVQFGIYQNTIWILGYTRYVSLGNKLIETPTKYLKLMVGQFEINEEYNSLIVDITSIKFLSTSSDIDYLEHLDEYVGMYYNKFNESLEFILHERQKQITELINLDEIIPENKDLYFIIKEYPLDFKNFVSSIKMNIPGVFPAFNLDYETYLYDLQGYKYEITDFKNISNVSSNVSTFLIGETVSGILSGNPLFATIDYDITSDKLIFNGKQILTDINKNEVIYLDISGLVVNFNINDETNKLEAIELKESVSSMLFNSELLEYNGSNTYTEETAVNIWRTNSDYNTLNIAYEALNTKTLDISLKNILRKKLEEQLRDPYYIGILKFSCKLFERHIFKYPELTNTGIGSISYEFGTTEVSMKNITNFGLLKLHNRYPKCELDGDILRVEVLISTLGGNKSSITNYASTELDEKTYNLLEDSLSENKSDAINKFKEYLKSNDILNKEAFSTGLTAVNEIISGDISSSISGDFFENENYEWNIKKYYDEYVEHNFDLDKLTVYNNAFAILTALSNFVPALNTCLTENMKLIFNFGESNYTSGLNDNLDLDIKVYIDDPVEKNKAVGWRCGYRQTSYLNWITYDNTTGRTRNSFCRY